MLLFIIGLYFFLRIRKDHLLLKKKDEVLKVKEEKVKSLLKENEWLLKELHHRVKNNLQIVTSLLHSQSAYLTDHAAINAIMGSQHRIQAMALLHKRLYQPESFATVFMRDYIADLVSYLLDSFHSTIRCDLQVEDINLQIVHAVPVGLILNEIITNAIKFAFPHSPHDCVSIRLFNLSPGEICLEVKDNGRGFPDGFNTHDKTSFGMLLMKGLTEQLDGVFSIENSSGAMIRVCFYVI